MIANGIGTTPGDDIAFTTLGGSGGGGVVPNGPGGKPAKKMCKVPKVVGKKINVARKKVSAAGCKFKIVYKKSKRPKNIVIAQSRKANKKLVYRAVVKLTVATQAGAQEEVEGDRLEEGQGEDHRHGPQRHELMR